MTQYWQLVKKGVELAESLPRRKKRTPSSVRDPFGIGEKTTNIMVNILD